MPAPPRARQPLPPGPRAAHRGFAPSSAHRPVPSGGRSRRRSHHRTQGPSLRIALVATLVVVTIAAGGWYALGRGGGGETMANDYPDVERRFATAAWAVHFTPLVVQQFRQLRDFNSALDAQALVMEQTLAEFDQIAKSEDGTAAEIARDSVKTAERALRAVSDFRDAIVTTNDLADAQEALDRIDAAARELDGKVKQWKQL